jgi:hypothetical protein
MEAGTPAVAAAISVRMAVNCAISEEISGPRVGEAGWLEVAELTDDMNTSFVRQPVSIHASGFILMTG